MKKVTLKALALLISVSVVLAADSISFKELTKLASKDIDSNIYLDKDIVDYSLDFNIVDNQAPGQVYEYYKIVLFDHNLQLSYNKKGNFYYVSKSKFQKEPDILPPTAVPADVDKLHYYSYKIKNITNKDVVKTMSIFPKSHYAYLEQSDIISYACTEAQHKQIQRMLHSADNKSKESLIKITLFATNKNKIKSFGSNIRKLSIDVNANINSIFDSLLNPQTPAHITIKKDTNFDFTLFALQGHGLVNIMQEPTIRISNGKEAVVKSGLNIGYKESTVSFQENQQTTTDQIKYRDVGIQIRVLPKIKDDWVHLDLDLLSEELISLEDNIPLTQKISYKSSVTIKKGNPVLLTGIQKTSMKFEKDGVPLLSSVPLIGELFKKQTRKHEDSNINILIEVL